MLVFKYIKRYPFTIFAFIIILYLCLMPSPKVEINISLLDKYVHTLLFLGLTLLLEFEFWRYHKQKISFITHQKIFLSLFLFAGSTELLQTLCTTTRHGDWLDFLADLLGIILAIFFVHFFSYLKK